MAVLHPSVFLAAFLLSGCTMATAIDRSKLGSEASLPTGARLLPTGYLAIAEVPPSPFPDNPPPEPKFVDDFARRTSSPDPAVRDKAWAEANGSPAFQAELQRLMQILPAREPDSFVSLRMVRDPAVAAEVWFKRDAARTLARHTSNPLFRPREGGATLAEQERLQSLWAGRMGRGSVINMLAVDPITGVVELGIAVEEAEFRRTAAERGWELGSQVKLMFPPPRLPAFADSSLTKYVRVFARESEAKGIQLLAGHGGRIVLDDGCFRMAAQNTGKPGPLVVFGRQTQLSRDEQGYLIVIGDGERRQYRVGEVGSWPGPNVVDESDPDVRELRRQCGSGPVTNVAVPTSERLFSMPYPDWVADYARAKSLSYGQAWQQVIACMKREEQGGRRGLEARNRCIDQFN